MADATSGESRSFSIARGPFLRVLSRLHLTRGDGMPRASVLVLIAWVPLTAGGVLHLAAGHTEPILRDLSVHGRLLIGIPLLVMAERILEERCRMTVELFYSGNFAAPAEVDRIVDRASRLRDSRLVELALFVLAIVGGQTVLWGLVGPTGLFAGVTDPGSLSFARLWYSLVGWPIAQFLFLRWLWHWAIWTYVLACLSRLPLATIGTHPDHAGGIGFLTVPIQAYYVFVFALATTLATAWGTQILAGHASIQTFSSSVVAVLVVMVVLGCGPLVPFTGMLYGVRRRELARYGELALEYVRAFDRKWVETRARGEDVLGTPDLQSLNDLLGAFGNLSRTRLVVFEARQLIGIAIATALPLLPLIATAVPVNELVKRIGGALLGGLPV